MTPETRCFYCNVKLANIPNKKDRKLGVRKFTRDHLIPRSMYVQHPMDQRQMQLNVVECCDKCNQHKGGKSPLTWLAMVDDNAAERIRGRLMQMGVWGTLDWAIVPRRSPPPTLGSEVKVERARGRT